MLLLSSNNLLLFSEFTEIAHWDAGVHVLQASRKKHRFKITPGAVQDFLEDAFEEIL